MANTLQWYFTELPQELIDLVPISLQKREDPISTGQLWNNQVNLSVRDSEVAWIPSENWIGSFIWYYIERANRENFNYDITGIEGESLQYTSYKEGQFYNWHVDADLPVFHTPSNLLGTSERIEDDVRMQHEYVRKLSFSLQLSNYTDYSGGELQFLSLHHDKTFFAPKVRGTLCIFDSRTAHRVRKVKSGCRKSLVGWVLGPRWK